MKTIRITILFSLVFFLIISCAGNSIDKQYEDVWPDKTWERSTPEAQGIDSKVLLDALKELNLAESGINSMIIIRNGFIIAEFYREPFSASTLQRINSCTKSFTSALVGIALSEKIIKSINQPVLTYFEEINPVDAKAANITIKDLLTMKSGFEWHNSVDFFDPKNDARLYEQEKNWIHYIFSKPIINKPGTVFEYNAMNSQLLADIIHRKSNFRSDIYVNEKLLSPIGINAWCWNKSPSGSITGGTALAMRTEDLARIGFLYLHYGMWDGNQIVPRKWVKDSLKPISSTGPNYPIPNYGYHWWVYDKNIFMASGGHGQICFVNRTKNLVVAINSNAEISQQINIYRFLFFKGLSDMEISSSAIPDNIVQTKSIREYLSSAGKASEIYAYTDQNSLKEKLNNKGIIFSNNELKIKQMHFTFLDDNKIVISFDFEKLNNDLKTYKEKFNLGKKYLRTVHYFAPGQYYGNNEYEHFGRVTQLNIDSIKFESIYTGDAKINYSYEIQINGDNVVLTRNTHKGDARQANSIIVFGRLSK